MAHLGRWGLPGLLEPEKEKILTLSKAKALNPRA
jgi:hypothetical protein